MARRLPPKDLAGARIAAVGHESAPVRWATFYRARVSEAETLPEAITPLEQGRVDGVLYNRPLLEYDLRQHPQAPYRLTNFDIGSEYIGIALPRGSALTQELNEILLQVDQCIRFEEVLRDWNIYESKPASRQSSLPALPSGETLPH
jgi:polar amino acid transport system substrate-binding protein